MAGLGFYGVARGRNPGVYYSWEDCKKEVVHFPNAIYRKFTREKEAWDFVKDKCRDTKLTAGTSPVKITNQDESKLIPVNNRMKRKLDTDNDDSSNDSVKCKLLERLQGIQVKVEEFHENVIRELATIKEEILGRTLSSIQTTSSIPISGSSPRESSIFNPHLPSTSKTCLTKNVESHDPDSQISTFRVNDEGYVEVYTDGACSKNGYNGAKAGIGVWFGDNHSLNISEPVRGRITNNCAEIEAATLAIEAASLAGITKLKVYTDSSFLISAVTVWIKRWKTNNWKTANGEPVKNKEELLVLDKAREGMDVIFEHVRGHAGIYGNDQADALARAGAEKCTPFKMK